MKASYYELLQDDLLQIGCTTQCPNANSVKEASVTKITELSETQQMRSVGLCIARFRRI